MIKNDDILRQFISEDKIKDIIRDEVDKQFNDYVLHTIKCDLNSKISNKADKYIQEKVDEVCSKGVRTDDGWGCIAKYDSFDNFVRKEIADKLSRNWDLKRELRNCLDKKIDKLLEKWQKEFADKNLKDFLDYSKKELKNE